MLNGKQQRAIYDALVANGQLAIAKAFMDAIASVRVPMPELLAAIEANDIATVTRLLTPAPADLFPALDATRGVYMAGGASASNIAQGAFTFNGGNPRAQAYLQQHAARMIAELSDDKRNAVSEILVDAGTRGQGAGTTARQLVGKINPATGKRVGGIIGLTNAQAGWVRNARTELSLLSPAYKTRKLRDKRFDAVVDKAIKTNKPLSAAQIERIAVAYESRVLQARGNLIGMTEANQAATAGQWEGFTQIVEAGATVTKRWRTGFSAEPRADHKAMVSAPARPFNEPFVLSGIPMRFPHDPDAPPSQILGCRCSVVYRVTDVPAENKVSRVTRSRNPRRVPRRAPAVLSPGAAILRTIKRVSDDEAMSLPRSVAEARLTKAAKDGQADPYVVKLPEFRGITLNEIGAASLGPAFRAEALSAISVITEELDIVSKAFKIPRLRGYHPVTDGNHNGSMGDGILALNANSVNSYVAETTAVKVADYIPGVSPAAARPWSVKEYFYGVDRLRSLMYHEMAHHVHQQAGKQGTYRSRGLPPVEKELESLWRKLKRRKDWASTQASSYAHANEKEWFAENFAAYMMGRRDLVDPEATLLIERLLNE